MRIKEEFREGENKRQAGTRTTGERDGIDDLENRYEFPGSTGGIWLPIGRMLRHLSFSAFEIVKTPANPQSVFLPSSDSD